MTKTPNYNLNQWDPEDPIRRTDFNADNAKLDAALHALEQGKALATDLASLQNTMVQIQSRLQAQLDLAYSAAFPPHVAGYYLGNGNPTQIISLGFTPTAVFVISWEDQTYISGAHTGGLAVPGSVNKAGISLVDGGFQVSYDGSTAWTNRATVKYHYIAFR